MLAGAVLVLLAAIGVVRFPDVLTRMQALTKASTIGVALVAVGSVFVLPTWNDDTSAVAAAVLQLMTLPISAVVDRPRHVPGARASSTTSTPSTSWPTPTPNETADRGRGQRQPAARSRGTVVIDRWGTRRTHPRRIPDWAVSAIAMLRRATSVAHRRLERQLDVMSADLSMAGYGSLLLGFAALHQTLDDEIGAQLDELDVAQRRRMPALGRDLDRLGLARPTAVAFPLTSPAGALGALYVSEGATLGGRVIAPHVRAVLGRDTPVEFFECSGVDVQARWTACRRLIDRSLLTSSDRTEAVARRGRGVRPLRRGAGAVTADLGRARRPRQLRQRADPHPGRDPAARRADRRHRARARRRGGVGQRRAVVRSATRPQPSVAISAR